MQDDIDIQIYEDDNRKCPYLQWEARLNRISRALVTARLVRIRMGNFGDCKTIQGVRGIYEMRIHFNPGYRIYFGKYQEKIVLLLCGGDKDSQKRDILKAKQYWQDFLRKGKIT